MKKKIYGICAVFAAVLLVPSITFASGIFTVTDATSTTVDWNNGSVAVLPLTTSDTTLAFTNGVAGEKYDLIATQDSAGDRAITWPSSVLWPDDASPALSRVPDASDWLTFLFDGTYYLGQSSIGYSTTPPPAPTVYFSDDFNRADSGSTGNGWTDEQVGSAGAVGISSDRQFSTAATSGSWSTYRTDITETSGVAITGEFSSANFSDGYYKTGILAADGYSSGGYNIDLDGQTNTVNICDETSCRASAAFTFNNTDKFEYEWDITAAPQNWSHLYVWDATAGSKPSSPTLSWTNGGSNFSPTTSGSESYFFNGLQHSETMYTYLYKVSSL